jgi:hypothetical protein
MAKQYLKPQERQAAYNSEAANISDFSAKISDLCKYVWAGSLAIFYALVTSSTQTFVGQQRSLLFIAAIAGALAFLFDYLQNISAYLHASKITAWLESKDEKIEIDEFNKQTESVYSFANQAFFVLKNIAVLVTAALVAYVIVTGFLK